MVLLGMCAAVERDDLNPQPVAAPGTVAGRPRGWRRGRARTTRLLILAAVGLALVLVARFSVQDFNVTGRSMVPTIHTNQMVLVDKISYDFISPQRGDIIVFHVPVEPKVVYIKRIIAVPGDRIQIYGGKVWVDGRALYEPYTSAPPNYTMGTIPGTNSDVVPNGEYFVLGDNRPHSNDSHRWGLVPRADIIGRAILAYWPLDRFEFLTDPSTAAPPRKGTIH